MSLTHRQYLEIYGILFPCISAIVSSLLRFNRAVTQPLLVKTAEMGKHHTSCMVASVLKRPVLAPRGRIYLFYPIKKKFYSKCFDPYPKNCAVAMRSCSTKYGSINLSSSRRAIRDNRYRFKTTRRIQVPGYMYH